MATSSLQPFNIVNMALRMLGDDALTSGEYTAATLRRAAIATEFYATTRDATLAEHPWNFATKRATLYAYTTPSSTLALSATTGTGVNVTTGASEFVAGDIGREIRQVGGAGVGEIVTFNDVDDVDIDITTNFSSSSLTAVQWRLYYPLPEWGFARSVKVPADCLRVWRIDFNPDYRVVGNYIHVDDDRIDTEYIVQQTDTTTYPFPFVTALATHLAAVMAEPITGQQAKADSFLKRYAMALQKAKGQDGQEGTPEILESNALTQVR